MNQSDFAVIYPGEIDTDVDIIWQCSVLGVDCPVCGLWGGLGFSYPSVACSELAALGDDVARRFHFRDAKDPEPMTIAEYRELKGQLWPVLGPDRPIVPGARFGSVTGPAAGGTADFLWASDYMPLVRESLFREFLDASIPVIGASADIDFGRAQELYVELEIRPTARLTADSGFRVCGDCGRVELYGRKLVATESLDESVPLQRVFEAPNIIVANKAVAEFLRDRNIANVKTASLVTG